MDQEEAGLCLLWQVVNLEAELDGLFLNNLLANGHYSQENFTLIIVTRLLVESRRILEHKLPLACDQLS